MNGCYLLSSFTNDSSLEVGINIPPIERIGKFETPTNTYNFKKGLKIFLFEWIEGQYSPFFYCMPDTETDINKAQIITAVSAKEENYTVVADTLETWIALAIENGLAFGWGNPSRFENEIKETKLLFDTKPVRRRVFLPGARVSIKQSRFLRGKVVKQYKSKEKDMYGRQDFTLVDYDIGGIYWMDSGYIKSITNKKDYYESLITNPKESLIEVSKMNAKDAAIALSRIVMDQNQYTAIMDERKDMQFLPAYPCDSIRLVQLFNTLPIEESSKIINDICTNCINAAKDNFSQMQKLPVNGSEYNKKDTHIVNQEFSYNYVLENLLGCLIYLIAREQEIRGENFSYTNEWMNTLKDTVDRANRLQKLSDPINGFNPTLSRFENLFESKNSKLRKVHEIKEWQEQMGIGDYPYILSL